MKYIDAEKLIAEIEKRMHICDGIFERDSDTYYQGKAVAYKETLPFIDFLQQEQPELDLNEEITAYIESHFHIRYDETLEVGNDPLTTADFEAIARYFYELGFKARKE